jgi:hypothetical protein
MSSVTITLPDELEAAVAERIREAAAEIREARD